MIVKRLSVYLRLFLPDTGFRNGFGYSDEFSYVDEMQSALEKSRLVPLGVSAAFDAVIHKSLLFKLQSAGFGRKVLGILTIF